jgi:protein TonB
VRITIARDGRVLAVELARSSGHPRLDRAAIESIQRWRFTPTKSRDARASVTIQHCVTFRLE